LQNNLIAVVDEAGFVVDDAIAVAVDVLADPTVFCIVVLSKSRMSPPPQE
jgi:hypothetical protein